MALTPYVKSDGTIIIKGSSSSKPKPSKTYSFNLETGVLANTLIDGNESIKQFIEKTVKTARFKFLIYSSDYGCELEEIIGHVVSQELLESEIPRVITDSLIIDDRIENVHSFVIEKKDADVFISFKVDLVDGATVSSEVSI